MNRSPVHALLGRAFRPLAAGLLTLAFGLPALAQTATPPSLVLVLKLISQSHARPVTGLVISPGGQVLVPASFVARGDDIVVLDGGTDIARHGRATRTVARSAELGLAVLAATGLHRPAATVAGDAASATELRFLAFPPAEELARGAPPITMQVRQAGGEASPRIEAETPLPNLDGVLLDRCGYLAGLVLADGDPGLERDRAPRTLLGTELSEALSALGLQPAMRNCQAPTIVAASDPKTAPEDPARGPQMLDPGTLRPQPPDLALTGSGSGESPAARPRASGQPPATAREPDQPPGEAAPAPPAASPAPASPPASAAPGEAGAGAEFGWVRILALVAVAAAGGWLLGRRGERGGRTVPEEAVSVATPPEPAPNEGAGDLPSPVDELRVQLVSGEGRAEERWIELPGAGGSVLLGSGQADFVIDDASVGRLHARLRRHGGALTLTDLGSGQGTWIAGIACLEGECFHLPDDAEIRLGKVSLRLLEDTGAGPEAAP